MPEKLPQLGRDSAADTPEKRALIAQARIAAEQAIELAKLATESARLARELSARAVGCDPNVAPDLCEPSAALTDAAALLTAPAPAPSDVPPASAFGAPLPAAPLGSGELEGPVSVPLRIDRGNRTDRLRRRERPRGRKALQARVAQLRRHRFRAQPKRVRVQVKHNDPTRDENLVVFLRKNWNSMTISGGVIATALLLLAFYIMPTVANQRIDTVIASFADESAIVEEALPVEPPDEEPGEQLEAETEQPVEEPEPEPEPQPDPVPVEPDPPPVAEVENPESTEPAMPAAPPVDFAKEGSRSDAAKQVLLEKYGGTAASESAVGNALAWFARHQRRDGSWNFNDVGQSGDAGTVDNPMGATSYVLLTFLGAGQTHLQGKYRRNVTAGLDYLMRRGRPVGNNIIDFSGVGSSDRDTHERFYVHGAAALALTEAWAMTRARKLRPHAQGAINAIVAAQDLRGGGWRYVPHEPGSTSVTGLQVTALFSAQKAGLQVPPQSLALASRYFDSVQSDEYGDRYGYTAARPAYKSSVTAIAVLCRMYLGWDRDTPQLGRAVKLLDEKGPASESLYYVYYATQVMRHWGGPEWVRWNEFTRTELVNSQSVAGDAAGSWKPRNRSLEAKAGGRLFMTCLATMTLEVYYRHLPLFEDLTGGK